MECNKRKITRLCHFTQSRNLAHIFDDQYKLFSTRTLKNLDMPHNPTDPNRHDGRDDLICCSIEYPNTYYFSKARMKDHLFEDWVVLLIEPCYLWHQNTCFCSCNAAKKGGIYIKKGFEGFMSLFAQTSPGINFSRPSKHLPTAPTDIQAEVLLEDPISLDSITGIVVNSKEQVLREKFRFKLQGITIDKPFYIAPDFFDRAKLSNLIQRGVKANMTLYKNGDCHGR